MNSILILVDTVNMNWYIFFMKFQKNADSLKSKLIKESLSLLKHTNISNLSLREVARRAEVSHNAPYRHFKNKDALIKELALQGFRLLTEAIDNHVSPPYTDIFHDLVQSGTAYLNFGINNPEYLKLLFSRQRPHLKDDHFRLLIEKGYDFYNYDAFGRLLGIVKAGIKNKQLVKNTNPLIFAINAWAQVHGLSHIVLENQIPMEYQNFKSLKAILKSYTQAVLLGSATEDYKSNLTI